MSLLEKLRSSGWLRYAAMVLDLTVAGAAFFLAYVTVFGWYVASSNSIIWEKTLTFIPLAGVVFVIFQVHRGSWRYVSIPEFLTIIKVSVTAVVVYTFGSFLLSRGTNVPRSVPVLAGMYLIAGPRRHAARLSAVPRRQHPADLGAEGSRPRRPQRPAARHDRQRRKLHSPDAPRFAGRRERRRHPRRVAAPARPVGAGRQGLWRASTIWKRSSTGWREKASRSPSSSSPRRRPAGSGSAISSKGRRASASRRRRIPDLTETAQLTSHSILEPKAIELGDLLGRPEVVADVQGIAGLINERTVLVTGAGGSIGSELCRQIALLSPRRLIITDSSEFHLYSLDIELREKFATLRIETRIVDVRDSARVNLVFAEVQAGHHLPRRGAEACSAGRGKSAGGDQDEPVRHAQRRQCGARRRRLGLRDDLDRQGGQSDQHHGRHQAGGGSLLPGARRFVGARSATRPSASATCWARTARSCRASRSRSPAADR